MLPVKLVLTLEHVILFSLDVSISLGEVVMLHNDSLSEIMKRVLQEVQIPLDKVCAI